MDEIDIELKQIQLQRERLALKRELHRSQWKTHTFGAVKRALAHGTGVLLAVVSGILSFVKRLWKLPALLTVCGALAYGGFEWNEVREQTKLDAVRAKDLAELREFVTAACMGIAPEEPKQCSESLGYRGYAACEQRSVVYRDCASEAMKLYSQSREFGSATAVMATTAPAQPLAVQARIGIASSAVGMYVVQVGQFADAAAAREAQQMVERRGFKTYTTTKPTSRGSRIHVRVGPFASREDADRIAGEIKFDSLSAVVLSL